LLSDQTAQSYLSSESSSASVVTPLASGMPTPSMLLGYRDAIIEGNDPGVNPAFETASVNASPSSANADRYGITSGSTARS